jgi:hypothetical protein
LRIKCQAMFTRRLPSLIAALCVLPMTLWAADPPAVKSGPEVGKDLPGPFHPFNVTGKEAGNFHCVVCTKGLEPVVLVFVHGIDKEVQPLLDALGAAVAKDPKARITAAAIFLYDDLKNVVTDDVNRKKYADTLEALKKVEHVILCLDNADGPKGYAINPDAKVTVLVCSKLQVVANFAYTDVNNINADAILAAVKEKLGTAAKK